MADVAVEVKDKEVVNTPEKEVEKKASDAEKETDESDKTDSSEQNGDTQNGLEKDEKEESLENGDTKEVSAVKRKSETGGGGDAATKVEGASPEKKAKLEEKVENGEAEATA